ncbi:hypothetical protein CP556_08740 [Natrinema sp. CBA1119]|uniref:hypothetical protein n=1 Tax=Natrinema sp. CBA1119 TaxID=1608465 RepID=UPI000BFA789E|nr:hypothetical protein [Natrinema sp. CBA1119]PGF16190.1 hypothetical protein CP556_08740 [Natrinema sp. CBA1119]
MTSLYDQLAERPQTKINVGGLSYDERADLRQIKVTQSTDLTNKGGSGRFTTVYYLESDEPQAAEVFVETNRSQLEGIDFSKKNVVQRGVEREVYDWILHTLGKRELEKYDSVVREVRPDENVTWVISRDHFDAYPMRRYSVGETPSVRIDGTSLRKLYDGFGEVITAGNLEEYDTVEGDVRYVLEYYRVADGFACDPVTHKSEMAIEKRDQ